MLLLTPPGTPNCGKYSSKTTSPAYIEVVDISSDEDDMVSTDEGLDSQISEPMEIAMEDAIKQEPPSFESFQEPFPPTERAQIHVKNDNYSDISEEEIVGVFDVEEADNEYLNSWSSIVADGRLNQPGRHVNSILDDRPFLENRCPSPVAASTPYPPPQAHVPTSSVNIQLQPQMTTLFPNVHPNQQREEASSPIPFEILNHMQEEVEPPMTNIHQQLHQGEGWPTMPFVHGELHHREAEHPINVHEQLHHREAEHPVTNVHEQLHHREAEHPITNVHEQLHQAEGWPPMHYVHDQLHQAGGWPSMPFAHGVPHQAEERPSTMFFHGMPDQNEAQHPMANIPEQIHQAEGWPPMHYVHDQLHQAGGWPSIPFAHGVPHQADERPSTMFFHGLPDQNEAQHPMPLVHGEPHQDVVQHEMPFVHGLQHQVEAWPPMQFDHQHPQMSVPPLHLQMQPKLRGSSAPDMFIYKAPHQPRKVLRRPFEAPYQLQNFNLSRSEYQRHRSKWRINQRLDARFLSWNANLAHIPCFCNCHMLTNLVPVPIHSFSVERFLQEAQLSPHVIPGHATSYLHTPTNNPVFTS
ncbi:hypothetical protein TSAR_000389 [Trichomalopsis sarcophagae]|uniref:Uncharacterized protein n=1 Tax=Trichomalopsis sarcophagae TaxID=543379 RepID=A0A232F808_9HYME|nr:hypothetical protein TSAR_000389 [Trichomalopsis sarcophagae]